MTGSRKALTKLVLFYLTGIILGTGAWLYADTKSQFPWFTLLILALTLGGGLFFWGRHCPSCGRLSKRTFSARYTESDAHGDEVITETRECAQYYSCGAKWRRDLFFQNHGSAVPSFRGQWKKT